jgi:TolA-binding protein
MPWAAPVLFLLLLAVPVFADQVDDLLTVARTAFTDGQYALALKGYQRVTAEFPESSRAEEAGYMLGVCLFYSEKWTESLAAFDDLAARHPGSGLLPRTGYWMAAANLKLGRNEKALALLSDPRARQAGKDPYALASLLLKGAALEALARDTEAAAAYRKLLADPDAGQLTAEALYRLAGTEYRAARFDSARDLYGKILISHPQSGFVGDSVFFLAECELALGNLPEAEKRYTTLLSLYPDSSYREAATFRLADVAWRQKKGDTALTRLDAFQRQFANGAYRGNALKLRAEMLFEQKKYDQALATFERALTALDGGAERQSVRYSMGLARIAAGRKRDAAEDFAAAASGPLAEIAEKAVYQRALLLAADGREQESVRGLEAYLAGHPDAAGSEEAERLLASLLDKQGDSDGAFARWDALVRDHPRSPSLPEYLFRRGNALLALEKPTAALDDFNRIVKEYPASKWKAESSYAIGWVYSQRGEYPRALVYFQSAAQDPAAGEISERGQLSYAICLFNMGSFTKALAGFQALQVKKLKSVDPGTIVLYMGRCLYRLERLDEAAQKLSEASRAIAPETSREAADARFWLAWSYLRLGRYPEARDAFMDLADHAPADPRHGEALFRAGICETMRRDDGAAVAVFEKVVSAPRAKADDDIREQALYELGQALVRLGRQQEGLDAFERLARDYPSGRLAPQAFFKLAEKSLDARRYDEARQGFQRVAREFPRSELTAQALYWSAEAQRRAGDARGALGGFWLCLKENPASGLLGSAMDGFRACLAAVGSVETAREYSENARAARALSVDARAGIQLSYADMLLEAEPEKALPVIKEAARARPSEPYAGEASLLMGRYYAAVRDWDRSLDVLGDLEETRADEIGARAAIARGSTLEAMGRTADAVEEFLKASYLFPDYSELCAEGLYNAVRVARARGDKDQAAKIEQTLRKGYPGSPWIEKLKER